MKEFILKVVVVTIAVIVVVLVISLVAEPIQIDNSPHPYGG